MNPFKLWLAQRMVNKTKGVTHSLEELERKHVEDSLPFTNDSSFFYGGDNSGNAFICRMAFRGKNRKPEAWFDFFLPGIGYVGLKGLPGEEKVGFQLGELKWEPTQLGKKWLISYEGELVGNDNKKYQSRVELEFSSDGLLYDFAQSSDKKLIAKAIASEKWNKTFFDKLKELSQTHYEQTGTLKGFVELDGKRTELNMVGLRDHSFGSRSWHTWDRHYWMSGVNEEGWAWTVTTIRYDFVGRLTAGFIISPNGETDAIIDCSGLEEISTSSVWPEKGIVNIKTRSGKMCSLEFQRKGHFPYLMDETYYMLEGIGNYHFNNSPGLGMIEFGFNKVKYRQQLTEKNINFA
jgi:hypothetical protein